MAKIKKSRLKKVTGTRKSSSSRKKAPVAKKRKIKAKIVKLTKKAAPRRSFKIAEPITKISSNSNLLSQIPDEKKYFTGPQLQHKVFATELPQAYNKDSFIATVRDPWWLYTYWEVTFDTFDKYIKEYGNDFYASRKVLRVYDVTNIIFNGKNANSFFDLDVNFEAKNWYINVSGAGRSWCLELGFILPNGEFVMILRSNVVKTPLDGPSWITDEEWMIPDDMFARLYGMGFGFGKTSPGKAWRERFKKALFSGILASPGMASMASPVKKIPGKRHFWLVVNTELIVYGATEPDAKVTVGGKHINLKPDGTFSLRFALPDGKQVIPVEATSKDKIDKRTITPIVTKETK